MAKVDKVPATSSEGRAVSPFDLLHSQIDRIFSDFGSSFGFSKSFLDDGIRMPSVWGDGKVIPFLEMHDADGKVTITAELPGVEEQDIDVSVDDQTLTISGEKKSEIEHKDGDRYRSERAYGKFSRTVSLPFKIDANKIDARYDKGVLKVTLEKPAEAQQQVKKIPIRH